MAFTAYHNITGSTGVDIELLAPGDNASNIKSIVIANTHATADATVSLFIQDDPTAATTSTFYMFKTVAIPSATSLLNLTLSYTVCVPIHFILSIYHYI